MISPLTMAPFTKGEPTFTLSPSQTIRTSPSSILVPGSPSSFSTIKVPSFSARNCLPPVLTITYMGYLSALRHEDELWHKSGWQMADGRRQMAVGSWQLAVGSWQPACTLQFKPKVV